MGFAEKVVVITGAGRGLGFGMARRFGQEGATVVIAEIDPQTGQQAAETLRAEGIAASYAPLDVRDPAQSLSLVENLTEEYGHVDVWVNTAGIARKALAESISIQAWDESIAVMLSGAFYCSPAAGRQMIAQGSGVIVNVASVGGI